jgi:LysM repeat protein
LAYAARSEKLTDMRPRTFLLLLAAGAALVAPTAASANFLHVVSPGETLSSVAATDGLTVDQLAAANGISPDTQLVAGSTLAIPPQTAAATTTSVSTTSSTTVGDGDADADDTGATSAAAPASGGSYVVQSGDTLSAIASRAGMTVDSLAALNGLNPDQYLLSGTVLKLAGSSTASSTSTSPSAATAQPVGAAAEGSSGGPPYPTPEQVSASEVGSIAAANGVPPSLADAIGYQESGFNNDLVSPADARGVMQILPGTWQWINSSLSSTPLSPSSAADNVRGGVLMLHSLLNATGGDPAMAAAGYYQGLPSVLQHGLYPDTQRYVNDVMSLASQFGG